MTHQTTGGALGHLARRCIHLSIALVPIIYYWFGSHFVQIFKINLDQCISLFVFIIAIFEMIRLRFGFLIFAQRHYERTQISALAWTIFSVAMVLLIAPKVGLHGAGIGAPLIWSLAFVDPVMGELRQRGISTKINGIIAGIITSLIWIMAAYFIGSPKWFFILIAPLTVAGELIRVKGIDDNALMLLLPLAGCVLLATFI